MNVRLKTLLVLTLWVVAGCGDDSGTPDAGSAGAAATAGAAGVSGGGGGGGVAAGTGGMSAGGTGGRSGGAGLGSDVCARAPVDSCDLLFTCASVKARLKCAGPIMFVACAPKQTSCAQTASYCAKDANGAEWYFPTSCGKDQIQKAPWTIETQCGCSESDAGTEDAGL